MKIEIVFHSRLLRAAFVVCLTLIVGMLAFLGLHASAATPSLPPELQKDAEPGKLLLLDFYSPYCGTCQMMEPHLADLKKKTDGRVVFKRINLGNAANEHLAEIYRIEGTPTYVLYSPEGKPLYKMDNLISPTVLEAQVMRNLGKLKMVAFPAAVPLPTADTTHQDVILVSFENRECQACRQMTPYLDGFEMTDQSSLHIIHLDTDTPSGKEMMKTLDIKSLPAYILFDNQADSQAEASTTHPDEAKRGELFRMVGKVQPRALWDVIRIFSQTGV